MNREFSVNVTIGFILIALVGVPACAKREVPAKIEQERTFEQHAEGAVEFSWGKNVKGIQCGVRPTKTSFTTGEFIVVEVGYRNTSTQPRTIYVRPDPFWQWMRYRIVNMSGWTVAHSPIGDGFRKPLEEADFRTIQPGETALVRASTRAIWLEPGQYQISVNVNRINRIDAVVHGFQEFCQKNDLSVLIAPIQSDTVPVTVTPMPPIQWGEPGQFLACGVGSVEMAGGNMIVPVFMKNLGTDRKYFDGATFEVEFDGERYLHKDWAAHNARQLHIPSGREIGPIPLALADYIGFEDRDNPNTAARSLGRPSAGSHRLRVVYVGMNGRPRIPSSKVTVTVIPSEVMSSCIDSDRF